MARVVSGNEAVALGALRSGVKVVTGYPGTPSSECIGSLLAMEAIEGTQIEWSTNEKVALEVAAGVAWAGQRALCTMKMSGVNVAYDSLISVAYSGCHGGLVVYVADDPGVSAGMCEQDSRGFALMSDMPILEPASVTEAYQLTKFAFALSEAIQSPVLLRSVASIAHSLAAVDVEEPIRPLDREPILERDINKYTKAGAVIGMTQHRQLIERLERAARIIEEEGINLLSLSPKEGGLGIIAVGVCWSYLDEGFQLAAPLGLERDDTSILKVVTSVPFPQKEVQALLRHCSTILVLEELEPIVERGVLAQAYLAGAKVKVIGKFDRTLGRIGSYNARDVARGLAKAVGQELQVKVGDLPSEAERLAAARPITPCAGCPHRGTYLAINRALRNLKYGKDKVMVTGDIGCTILGMNPPFHTVWNEISMGASIALAHGFVYSGVKTPVLATIGDSTFLHNGMPGLINAVHHQVPITVVIMDNGWTAMTGMQVNPATPAELQPPGKKQVDLERLIPAMGVEHFFVIDPYDLDASTATIREALTLPGVKVILARRECAIQSMRRGVRLTRVTVDEGKCNQCKACISVTGCPALSLGAKAVLIDDSLCNGCGLCVQLCGHGALVAQPDGEGSPETEG